MTRVAAFDCGTNSLRLLVADPGSDGSPHVDVVRRMEIVRLGQGVDRTGRLDPAAIERTLAVAADYAVVCADLGVERTRFVATSATRDAANASDFVDGVRDILGVEPEVVSGDQEAQLSFVGATAGLGDRHPAPYCVVDLGGGSTELVLGDGEVEAAWSMDVGCVRMTERHLADDPPTQDQIDHAAADVDAALDIAGRTVPLSRTATLVGVAGSVTTITAHALGLPTYDADRIHGAELSVQDVLLACASLVRMPRAERAALGFMHPGRVDVIGAGALVWSRVVARAAELSGVSTVVTSEHDILDGIALSQF